MNKRKGRHVTSCSIFVEALYISMYHMKHLKAIKTVKNSFKTLLLAINSSKQFQKLSYNIPLDASRKDESNGTKITPF